MDRKRDWREIKEIVFEIRGLFFKIKETVFKITSFFLAVISHLLMGTCEGANVFIIFFDFFTF